jgi:hypothetical protein
MFCRKRSSKLFEYAHSHWRRLLVIVERTMMTPGKGQLMSQLLELYRSLGNEHYAGAISNLAPYFGTINPQFKELCEVTARW